MKKIKTVRFFSFIVLLLVLLIAGRVDSYADYNIPHLDSGKSFKEKLAEEIVDSLYGDLNADIQSVVGILSMNPDSNTVVWGMIQGVSKALVPAGFTLAASFLLLSFLNKAMLFQLRTYEDVMKVLLFMMLARVVLMSSFELMGFLYSAGANLIASAAVTPEAIVSDVDKALLVAQLSKMSIIEFLQFQMSRMPVATVMGLIKIAIKVVAYGRLFEIYIYMAVAPLPLATLASPDHYHIAKKFIQAFIGVCLQGLIMMLSCVIFSALAVQLLDPSLQGEMTGGGGGFLLASLVLLFVLVKSGSWGKQVAGLV